MLTNLKVVINPIKNNLKYSNKHLQATNFKFTTISNNSNQLHNSENSYLFPFPTKITDLDQINQKLLAIREQFKLSYDQFRDQAYVKRKAEINRNALQYKINQKIKDIHYSQVYKQLWTTLYKKLRFHHKSTMCREYLRNIDQIEKQFKPFQQVPQLNQLSQYLKMKTGFRLNQQRDDQSKIIFKCIGFQNLLLHTIQYIRHPNSIEYSPEPDFFHQFVGHIPMFADQYIAEISQQIGLMSLGASDENIKKLGTLYLYIVEFGAVKQKNNQNKVSPKAFGAGIAGSVGKMKHFLSEKAQFKDLQIETDALIELPLQELQYVYRVSQSIERALSKLLAYQQHLQKNFIAVMNKKTLEIETEPRVSIQQKCI